MQNFKQKGFTLAEVLITLGIIGIVAAISIPTLISKMQKQQVETRMQHLHSTLLQGFKMHQAKDEWYDFLSIHADNKEHSKKIFKEFFAPIFTGTTEYNGKTLKAYSRNGGATYQENNVAFFTLNNGVVLGLRSQSNGNMLTFYIHLAPQKQRPIVGKDYFVLSYKDKDGNGNYEYSSNSSNRYNESTRAAFLNACGSEMRYPLYSSGAEDLCTVILVKNNFKFPKDYPIRF